MQDCSGLLVGADGPCDASCEGDVRTACDGPWRFTVDCGGVGMTCDADRGRCMPPGLGGDCGDGEDDFLDGPCVDGSPSRCWYGRERLGVDCESLGLACKDDDRGVGWCEGKGAECDSRSKGPYRVDLEDGGLACDGDTLTTCVGDREHIVDCRDLHPQFHCFAPPEVEPFCGFEGGCELLLGGQKCSDGKTHVCAAGRTVVVVCRELGFDDCEPGRGGGRCTPGIYANIPRLFPPR